MTEDWRAFLQVSLGSLDYWQGSLKYGLDEFADVVYWVIEDEGIVTHAFELIY